MRDACIAANGFMVLMSSKVKYFYSVIGKKDSLINFGNGASESRGE